MISRTRLGRERSDVDDYEALNRTLSTLREEFHRSGRFDDSNVKLDEIVKLLAIRLYESKREPDRFSYSWLSERASALGTPGSIASVLRALAEDVLCQDPYLNGDGTSIFGSHARLNLHASDDRFAATIVEAVRSIPIPDGTGSGVKLDLLNEAFGHFVRDSFRNHKEDAQYMTPTEVIECALDMVFADIARDNELDCILRPNTDNPFIIADPTCGVGSFPVSALHKIIRLSKQAQMSIGELDTLVAFYRDHCLFAQDKVDRMVRLAKLNFMMFGGKARNIWQGNSIFGVAPLLDGLMGKVALIITNPPFGAECHVSDLANAPGFQQRYPMLSTWYAGNPSKSLVVNSELALLDRCMALLRPGGRLLIILPDSVVSAKGMYAEARKWLQHQTILRSVVELPAVTFAQAGTRTKTCILYLQKPHVLKENNPRIFMSVCNHIGFSVNERGGIPIKQVSGHNELIDVARIYANGSLSSETYEVASNDPACVWLDQQGLLNGRWTSNFYQPKRLEALSTLLALDKATFEVRSLAQVAKFCSPARRVNSKVLIRPRCISVLHVQDDGAIDIRQVLDYRPKTPGLICHPGEVLLSKINPRIPRVCVVPDLHVALTCSSEFEVLRPVPGIDPFVLASLLLMPVVQQQIQCLTSGTSSSHNRIKDAELAQVQVPVPIRGSSIWGIFVQLAEDLRRAFDERYKSVRDVDNARNTLASLLSTESGDHENGHVAAVHRREGLGVQGKDLDIVEVPGNGLLFSMED